MAVDGADEKDVSGVLEVEDNTALDSHATT